MQYTVSVLLGILLFLTIFLMVILVGQSYSLWAAQFYARFMDTNIGRRYQILKNISKAYKVTENEYNQLLIENKVDFHAAYHFLDSFWLPTPLSEGHDIFLLSNDPICYPLYKEQYKRFFGEDPI